MFGGKPQKLYRALSYVRITSKVFFKLVEKGVISLKYNSIQSYLDLTTLNTEQIEYAIEKYTNDINSYPLFYDIKSISCLNTMNFIDDIKDIYNKYYQTSKGKAFGIPYNQIINRNVIALKVEDIIIRYILINHIKEQTNYIPSTERYDEESIKTLCHYEINNGEAISIRLDILNCYESIKHSKLKKVLSERIQLDKNSIFLSVLNNALEVIYEDERGEVIKKTKGLLIGSKPDEYLAEFFLDKVEESIKEEGIFVVRIADEIIYFANSFSNARKKYETIEQTIKKYGLKLNKAKTTVNDFRQDSLNAQFNLDLVNIGSSSPMLSYELKKTKEDNIPENIVNKEQLVECDINKIESYDTAILFLKNMLQSKKDIYKYQKKIQTTNSYITLFILSQQNLGMIFIILIPPFLQNQILKN